MLKIKDSSTWVRISWHCWSKAWNTLIIAFLMGGITSANSEYICGKPGRLIIKLNIGEIQTTLFTHVLIMDDALFPHTG